MNLSLSNYERSIDVLPQWFDKAKYTFSDSAEQWISWLTIREIIYIWVHKMKSKGKLTKEELKKLDNYLSKANQHPPEKLSNELGVNSVYDKKKMSLRTIGVFNDKNTWEVAINLSASDEQILKDFEGVLRHKRLEETNSMKKKLSPITEAEFKRWDEYRVLAYIDLYIWQQANDVKLKDISISECFWPDNDDPIPRLRKSTMKHANTVISANTRERLLTVKYST